MKLAYICTGCGFHYGPEVAGRQIFGYCGDCWALWLAQARVNARRLHAGWCREKGWTPRAARSP